MIVMYNSTLYPGFSGIMLYINSINTLFIPGTLFMIFMIAFISSLIYQQRSMNLTNPPAAFTFAGFLTFVLSLVLSLIPGLVVTQYVLITISVLIVGFIWLMTSGRS